jgi:hypothetical protein
MGGGAGAIMPESFGGLVFLGWDGVPPHPTAASSASSATDRSRYRISTLSLYET